MKRMPGATELARIKANASIKAVIDAIEKSGPMTVKQIQFACSKSNSAAWHAVNRACNAGYVKARRGNSPRVFIRTKKQFEEVFEIPIPETPSDAHPLSEVMQQWQGTVSCAHHGSLERLAKHVHRLAYEEDEEREAA